MTNPGTADHPASPQAVGFDKTIGLVFDEASADRVVAHFDVAEHLLQPFGIVHGGVYCTVVETCASFGASLWFGQRAEATAKDTVVGVSNHTDFLRAIGTGRATATATPIHRGRSQQLWQVEVADETQRLLARGQVRLANLTGGSQ